MKKIILYSLILSSLPIFAQKPEQTPPEKSTWQKVKDTSSEKAAELSAAIAATSANRGSTKWTMTGNYSLFETWVLSRHGFTIGFNRSQSSTYELEYMRGSLGFGAFGLDFGEIAEQRLAFLWRNYDKHNSFNFTYGLFYNQFDIHLRNKWLQRLSGTSESNINVAKIDTIGVSWGFGNRWQTKGGFILGFDWLTINLPLFVTREDTPFLDKVEDRNDRREADEVLHVLKKYPAFAVIKIQLGFSF